MIFDVNSDLDKFQIMKLLATMLHWRIREVECWSTDNCTSASPSCPYNQTLMIFMIRRLHYATTNHECFEDLLARRMLRWSAWASIRAYSTVPQCVNHSDRPVYKNIFAINFKFFYALSMRYGCFAMNFIFCTVISLVLACKCCTARNAASPHGVVF